MNTLADRIDLRQLAERLRKGWLYIFVGVITGLLWTIFLNLLPGEKILYQKEMFYKVEIAEEICPLRKKDIEYCIYGEDRRMRLKKQKISHRDLEEKVILLITEPMDISRQIENFKIFIRSSTALKTIFFFNKIEKKLYTSLKQKALSVLSKNIEELKEELSGDKNIDFLKSLRSRLNKLQQYKELILKEEMPILERVSQTQPEVIWQMPNILFDLPSALIIGLASGIILALLYVKR